MTKGAERLESDVAFKTLSAVAARWPETVFLSKLPAVFGSDIPAESYRKLRKALLDKDLVQPTIELVTTGLMGHEAGYDNTRRVILVDRQLVSMAERDKARAATLFIALIEEFGHHLDNLLRTEYSRQGGDGPRDEGAALACALYTQWQAAPPPVTFATYVRPGLTRKLSTDASSFKNALHQHTTEPELAGDEKAGPVQFFGAGRGHGKAGHSFGHQSIEDALANSFPDPRERREIYFGNWLRDYSQVLDPKLVRPSSSKNIMDGLTRESLTRVLDVLAREEFGNQNTFKVTPDKLGVYRAEEHIDNPHGIEDGTSRNDPGSKTPGFRKKWMAAEVELDPTTGMLNYIANRKGSWVTSAAYIEQELRAAVSHGRSVEGRRRFGQALHTLEDFYSHSNFAELLLLKLGHTHVYPWVHKKVQAPTLRYPLVTGKFGSNDIQVSGAYVISENLKATTQCLPGNRSTSAQIMLIVLKDIPPAQLDPRLVKKFESLLEFKEGLEKKYPWLGEKICEVSKLVSALPNAMLAAKAKDHATDVTKSQEEFLKDASSTHPTHSQLAKDHDDHPLHVLTARLAMGAVREVGGVMAQVWAGRPGVGVEDVVRVALKYLVHPEDLRDAATDSRAWIFKTATQWAAKNPAKLKLLERSAIIDRQFTHAKEEQAKLRSQLEASGRSEELLAQLRSALQMESGLA